MRRCSRGRRVGPTRGWARHCGVPPKRSLKMSPVHGELQYWPEYGVLRGLVTMAGMRDLILLFVHVIVTLARMAGPGAPFRGCRIRAHPASTVDPQSRAQACAQPSHHRSHRRRFVHPLHETGTHPPYRHRSEALHLAASAQPVEETKIPRTVFAPARMSTRPERTEPRTHRRRRGHEGAQSQLGLSSHRPTDRVGFRRRDR